MIFPENATAEECAALVASYNRSHPRTTKIIGIAGYARSGKDTLGGILVEEHGFEQRSFAAALKDVLYATNPMVYTDKMRITTGDEFISVQALVDLVGWDKAKEISPGPFGVRGLLQRLGTEGGREVLGQNVWVDAAMSTLEPGGSYVFTDMRFPNEYEAVRGAGGLCARIYRLNAAPVNPHISETALDTYAFPYIVRNDGTIDDLREIARTLVRA